MLGRFYRVSFNVVVGEVGREMGINMVYSQVARMVTHC